MWSSFYNILDRYVAHGSSPTAYQHEFLQAFTEMVSTLSNPLATPPPRGSGKLSSPPSPQRRTLSKSNGLPANLDRVKSTLQIDNDDMAYFYLEFNTSTTRKSTSTFVPTDPCSLDFTTRLATFHDLNIPSNDPIYGAVLKYYAERDSLLQSLLTLASLSYDSTSLCPEKASEIQRLVDQLVTDDIIVHLLQAIEETSQELQDGLSAPQRDTPCLELRIASLIMERRLMAEIIFLLSYHVEATTQQVDTLIWLCARITADPSNRLTMGGLFKSDVTSIMTAPTARMAEWMLREQSHANEIVYLSLASLCTSLDATWETEKRTTQQQQQQQPILYDNTQWIDAFSTSLLHNALPATTTSVDAADSSDDMEPILHDGMRGAIMLIWAAFLSTSSVPNQQMLFLRHGMENRGLVFLRCALRSSEFVGESVEMQALLLEVFQSLVAKFVPLSMFPTFDVGGGAGPPHTPFFTSSSQPQIPSFTPYHHHQDSSPRPGTDVHEGGGGGGLTMQSDLIPLVSLVCRLGTDKAMRWQSDSPLPREVFISFFRRVMDNVDWTRAFTPMFGGGNVGGSGTTMLPPSLHHHPSHHLQSPESMAMNSPLHLSPTRLTSYQSPQMVAQRHAAISSTQQAISKGLAECISILALACSLLVSSSPTTNTDIFNDLLERGIISGGFDFLAQFDSFTRAGTDTSTVMDVLEAWLRTLHCLAVVQGSRTRLVDAIASYPKAVVELLFKVVAMYEFPGVRGEAIRVLAALGAFPSLSSSVFVQDIDMIFPAFSQQQSIGQEPLPITTRIDATDRLGDIRSCLGFLDFVVALLRQAKNVDMASGTVEVESKPLEMAWGAAAAAASAWVPSLTTSNTGKSNVVTSSGKFQQASITYVKTVLLDVFWTYDQRHYERPGDRWRTATGCLNVLLTAVATYSSQDGTTSASHWVISELLRGGALFHKVLSCFAASTFGLENATTAGRRRLNLDGVLSLPATKTRSSSSQQQQQQAEWSTSRVSLRAGLSQIKQDPYTRPDWFVGTAKHSRLIVHYAKQSSTATTATTTGAGAGGRVKPYGLIKFTTQDSQGGASVDAGHGEAVARWLAGSEYDGSSLWDDGDSGARVRETCAGTALRLLWMLAQKEDEFITAGGSSMVDVYRIHSLIMTRSREYLELLTRFASFSREAETKKLALDLISRVADHTPNPAQVADSLIPDDMARVILSFQDIAAPTETTMAKPIVDADGNFLPNSVLLSDELVAPDESAARNSLFNYLGCSPFPIMLVSAPPVFSALMRVAKSATDPTTRALSLKVLCTSCNVSSACAEKLWNIKFWEKELEEAIMDGEQGELREGGLDWIMLALAHEASASIDVLDRIYHLMLTERHQQQGHTTTTSDDTESTNDGLLYRLIPDDTSKHRPSPAEVILHKLIQPQQRLPRPELLDAWRILMDKLSPPPSSLRYAHAHVVSLRIFTELISSMVHCEYSHDCAAALARACLTFCTRLSMLFPHSPSVFASPEQHYLLFGSLCDAALACTKYRSPLVSGCLMGCLMHVLGHQRRHFAQKLQSTSSPRRNDKSSVTEKVAITQFPTNSLEAECARATLQAFRTNHRDDRLLKWCEDTIVDGSGDQSAPMLRAASLALLCTILPCCDGDKFNAEARIRGFHQCLASQTRGNEELAVYDVMMTTLETLVQSSPGVALSALMESEGVLVVDGQHQNKPIHPSQWRLAAVMASAEKAISGRSGLSAAQFLQARGKDVEQELSSTTPRQVQISIGLCLAAGGEEGKQFERNVIASMNSACDGHSIPPWDLVWVYLAYCRRRLTTTSTTEGDTTTIMPADFTSCIEASSRACHVQLLSITSSSSQRRRNAAIKSMEQRREYMVLEAALACALQACNNVMRHGHPATARMEMRSFVEDVLPYHTTGKEMSILEHLVGDLEATLEAVYEVDRAGGSVHRDNMFIAEMVKALVRYR